MTCSLTVVTWAGLAEQLFERLTSSPAEPYLKALQELYINFWGMCCLYSVCCAQG